MEGEDLTDLPNIGPRCAEWLRQAGIETAADLRSIGYPAAYQSLVSQGTARPHRMLLYALAGAVRGENCLRFSPAEKREIEEEAGLI